MQGITQALQQMPTFIHNRNKSHTVGLALLPIHLKPCHQNSSLLRSTTHLTGQTSQICKALTWLGSTSLLIDVNPTTSVKSTITISWLLAS